MASDLAIKVVDLDDDIILISADGIIIRIQANSIRVCARPSKGVRVMKIVGEGNKVVTLSRAPHEEGETEEIEEELEAETSEENEVEEETEPLDAPTEE